MAHVQPVENRVGTVEIPLGAGQFALIDAADARFADMGWHLHKAAPGKFYAAKKNAAGKRIYLHRVILGEPAGLDVDHINGDGLDDRRENLRACTHSDNMRNQRKRPSASSTFRGVSFCKKTGKWAVFIRIDAKRRKYLGRFVDEGAAAQAYDGAARAHHGEFARLNFPDGAPLPHPCARLCGGGV